MTLDKVKQEIIEEAEEKAQEIREEAENQANDEAESLKKQELASTRMKAQEKKMEAKQDVIHEAFQQLRERINSLDKDEKEKLFHSVIDTVSDEIDIGTVYVSGEMVGSLTDSVDARIEEKEIEGLIIENEDGSVRYDYSFDSVLQNIQNKYRKDVAQELFG